MSTCPFCKCDPYEYVDVGVGYVPVAVNCCDPGYYLYCGWGDDHGQELKTMHDLARRILRLRRSHSPRRKARAAHLLRRLEE